MGTRATTPGMTNATDALPAPAHGRSEQRDRRWVGAVPDELARLHGRERADPRPARDPEQPLEAAVIASFERDATKLTLVREYKARHLGRHAVCELDEL